MKVIIAIIDEKTNKSVKQIVLGKVKETDNYAKFSGGDRGDEIIGSVYIQPGLLGEKSKAELKAEEPKAPAKKKAKK